MRAAVLEAEFQTKISDESHLIAISTIINIEHHIID